MPVKQCGIFMQINYVESQNGHGSDDRMDETQFYTVLLLELGMWCMVCAYQHHARKKKRDNIKQTYKYDSHIVMFWPELW